MARRYEFYVRVLRTRILITAFLTTFRRFATTSQRYPKLKDFQDYRRLPKTFEEDPKMFRSYTSEFKYNLRDKNSISEIIDIFAGENSPRESRMWFRVKFPSGVFSSKTLLFI